MTTAKKILLVEDEALLAGILEERLSQAGYTVIRAVDGEEGLRQVEEQEPQLVVTDILLPVLDGVAMIKQMREKEALKETPIIILTNLETVDGIERVIQEPRDMVLKKTYLTLEHILTTIQEKL